jgi:putative SOS response-associated peptidase YedK
MIYPARHRSETIPLCGRYSLVCIDDLGNRFRVHNSMIGARSHFNISPGNEMPVIIHAAGKKGITVMEWGLVTYWRTDIRYANRQINARAETIAEKPAFHGLLDHHRCLVPASGFFEWKNEGDRKVPFYVHLPAEPLFAFAGLYGCVG